MSDIEGEKGVSSALSLACVVARQRAHAQSEKRSNAAFSPWHHPRQGAREGPPGERNSQGKRNEKGAGEAAGAEAEAAESGAFASNAMNASCNRVLKTRSLLPFAGERCHPHPGHQGIRSLARRRRGPGARPLHLRHAGRFREGLPGVLGHLGRGHQHVAQYARRDHSPSLRVAEIFGCEGRWPIPAGARAHPSGGALLHAVAPACRGPVSAPSRLLVCCAPHCSALRARGAARAERRERNPTRTGRTEQVF